MSKTGGAPPSQLPEFEVTAGFAPQWGRWPAALPAMAGDVRRVSLIEKDIRGVVRA